jgi:chromosome segregation ATPase
MKQTEQERIKELEQRVKELEEESAKRLKLLVSTQEHVNRLNDQNDEAYQKSPHYGQMQRDLKAYKKENETLRNDIKQYNKRLVTKDERILQLELKCDDLQEQLVSKNQVRSGSLNPDGRPRKLKGEQEQEVIQYWNDTKASYKEISKHFSISPATVCRIMKRNSNV